MKIREVMTTAVVSVRPAASYKEAVERLVTSGVSGLPVVGERDELVGIVTEADLISKEAYGARRHRALAVLAEMLSVRDRQWVPKAAGNTVADVMTAKPSTCRPDEDVRVVARRMLEYSVKRMPVVDEHDALVGIVSRQDLLRVFARPDDEIAEDVTRVLMTHPNRPDDHRVQFSVMHGVVTLTGDVRFPADSDVVVSLVRDVVGVIDVVSHVHNREPDPTSSTIADLFARRW